MAALLAQCRCATRVIDVADTVALVVLMMLVLMMLIVLMMWVMLD